MNITVLLKNEIRDKKAGKYSHGYFRSFGYEEAERIGGLSASMKRAYAIRALFSLPKPHIYKNDIVPGSLRTVVRKLTPDERIKVDEVMGRYPERSFRTNADHYSPDFVTPLTVGIPGVFARIAESEKKHAGDPMKLDFLSSMETALTGFAQMLENYAVRAEELVGTEGYDRARLTLISNTCHKLTKRAPESFYEALTLVWLINIAFNMEGRDAMALGRMDQYLYPFYKKDIEDGVMTREQATLLLENVYMKTHENRMYNGDDQTVNICIGGMKQDGTTDVNELSYVIIDAVKGCNIPGPNLSARISPSSPDEFLDACLKSIGTGLGYPALMNDEVNIAALLSFGYEPEDVYNYSMVGCIENFLTGMQAPWSDSRFDTPKYLELVMGEGNIYYDDPVSREQNFDPRDAIPVRLADLHTMEEFMRAFEAQLAAGARSYMEKFYQRNVIPDPENYTSPFLSIFCYDCIGRGLDINMGGAKYAAAHAPGLMGVATVVDSLAAIEKVVFVDKAATLTELAEALKNNFVGYEQLRERLLAAPKYGNNDDFVDKYAVWYADYLSGLFRDYKTYDGGNVFVGMASNVSNVPSGKMTGATPDGRLAGAPLSDAASPTYGKDTKGPTSTFLSCSKPNYKQVGCGTVINQKYSPSMFSDEKRAKLLSMIRVYFAKGGQEVQINSTSPEILRDAMAHPENYQELVVRVSGFSSYYVTLSKEIQEDILMRTQQG